MGLEDRPKTLDPRWATDVYGQRIGHHLLYDPLVEHGYELEVIPALARSWEAEAPDRWRIDLRPGVLFHDGHRLTADDVVATFEHLMAEQTASPLGAGLREVVAQITAEGPLTVRFELRAPSPGFLETIMVPILSRPGIQAHPPGVAGAVAPPPGTGAFRWLDETPAGLRLERFDGHFRGPAGVEFLVFDRVKDENTRLLKLRRGELDLLINALPERTLELFERPPWADLYRLDEAAGLGYNYLAFNFRDPVLARREVRRAIAHALDVDSLIRHRLRGHAVRSRSLLSPRNPAHDATVPLVEHDPARARELLDSAGLPDPDGDGPAPRVTLELKVSNDPKAVDNARAIRAQLAEVGIAVNLRSLEWGTFYGDVTVGNFQLTSLRWIGVTDPDFYFDLYHSSRQPPLGRNRGRFADPRLDALVESGRQTLDPERRREIYSRVQHLVADELPYVSLWHTHDVSVVHRRVAGYRSHPKAGFQSLRHATLEPWPP